MELFGYNAIWLSSPEIQGTLIICFTTLLIEITRRLYTAKAKIKWGISHGHNFYIPPTIAKPVESQDAQDSDVESEPTNSQNLVPQGTSVNVQQTWIQNIGRGTATNINVILDSMPQNFNIWPVVEYTTTSNPDGRLILNVKHLHRRQYFTLSMLQVNGKVPELLSIACDEGNATKVLMGPQQVFPPWIGGVVLLLSAFGFSAVLYFGFNIIFG